MNIIQLKTTKNSTDELYRVHCTLYTFHLYKLTRFPRVLIEFVSSSRPGATRNRTWWPRSTAGSYSTRSWRSRSPLNLNFRFIFFNIGHFGEVPPSLLTLGSYSSILVLWSRSPLVLNFRFIFFHIGPFG